MPDSAHAAAREPDYERLKRDAVSRDETTRLRVSGATDTPAELLFFLAADRSLAVRAAVAMNPATPPQADQRLTRDADERVRMILARKLAALTPSLGGEERARIGRQAWENLSVLIGDEVEQVRALVADLVKGLPDAPRALILRLAHDTALSVSDPVLRLSPALTQEDLLALLECAPAPHTAESIACRANIGGDVADAIARTAGREAIRCLLANPTAAIRETTLDTLMERAREEVSWHEPLVRRPALSARNARLLSGMVVEQLIGVLAARPDLDPAVTRDLHERLEQRLTSPNVKRAEEQPPDDEVTERVLVEAIRSGQVQRLMTLLARGAEVPLSTVQRAARLRSVKAVVSLVWKAGLPARIAVPAQTMLCNVGPGATLRPATDGGFPLGEEEMRWQVEFVTRAVA